MPGSTEAQTKAPTPQLIEAKTMAPMPQPTEAKTMAPTHPPMEATTMARMCQPMDAAPELKMEDAKEAKSEPKDDDKKFDSWTKTPAHPSKLSPAMKEHWNRGNSWHSKDTVVRNQHEYDPNYLEVLKGKMEHVAV